METIWFLSFDKGNVKEILKIEEILDVAVSSSRDRSVTAEFRKSACGLLFQLRDELVLTDKYRDFGKLISNCYSMHVSLSH